MAARSPLRVGCAVLAVLLVLSVAVPGALSTLGVKDTSEYQHTVEPISGNWSTNETEPSPVMPSDEPQALRYEELSPETQVLFDRTFDGTGPPNGTRTYTPTVCRPDTYFCPHRSPDDLAPELSYEGSDDPDAAVVVVTDDGNYLFTTPAYESSHHDGWVLPMTMIRVFLVFPFAGLLAWMVTKKRTPYVQTLAIANGTAIGYLVLGHTYVAAYNAVSAAILQRWVLALGCSWGGTLVIGSVAVVASRRGPDEEENAPRD